MMDWIFGPQLIGFIILAAGIIQKYFPPKKINSLYGYRTPASMKNQQIWDEANHYSTQLMIKGGIIMVVAGLALTYLFSLFQFSKTTASFIQFALILIPSIGFASFLIYATEKHLQKVFGCGF